MPRKTATLIKWNDDKGFGFAQVNISSQQFFLHISEFSANQRRPKINDQVSFVASKDAQGRLRGTDAKIEGIVLSRKFTFSMIVFSGITIAFFGLLGYLVYSQIIPPLVPYFYIVMSGMTYAAYRLDKSAAQNAHRRTPEDFLQFLALLSGWPGALLAQQFIRHKSRKTSFQLKFWIMTLLNCSALYWLINSEFQLVLWFLNDTFKTFVIETLSIH